MGIIKRQGIKTTIASYIGLVFGIVNLLYLYPKFLLPEEIGLIRTLTDIGMLIAPFALLGTSSVIVRYAPYFNASAGSKREFVSLFLLLPLVGFILFSILYFIFQDHFIGVFEEKSPLLLGYTFLILPLVFLFMYHYIFESYARSLFRITVPKLIRDVLIRVLIAFVIIGYAIFAFDLSTFVYLYVAIFFIAIVAIIIYANRLGSLKPTFKFATLTRSYLKEILTYSFFVLFGSIGGAVVARIDILMVSAMVGLTGTGIYTISLFMGTVIEIPRRAISQIALPVISKALKDENYAEISDLYKKSALNQLIIGGFILIGLWASVDHLFDIMPKGNIYQEGKYVVLFIGLAKLFDMAMGLNNEILVMSKFYRYNILLMLFFVVVAVVTNYYFIPAYGIVGAAIATFISVVFYNIARFFIVYFAFNLHPFSMDTIKVMLILMVTYLIAYSIPRVIHPAITIVILAAVVSVVFWGLILYFNVSKDITALTKEGIEMLKSKMKRD